LSATIPSHVKGVDGLEVGAAMTERSIEGGRESTRARTASMADRLLFGAILLAIAMMPFEAGYPPLGRFLWAKFTNLEVALFALGGVWALKMAVDPSARVRFARLPLLMPIAALVLASALSTVFGEYKSLGVQFIYRLLMGTLVYVSVAEGLRARRRLIMALATLVSAGLLSAVLGLLEFVPGINIEPWLRAFKPQPTTVGGVLRLSGSFEYANGAAVFFEMLLPLTLGLIVLFSSRRLTAQTFGEGRVAERRRRAWLAALFVCTGIFAMALLLTLSRAALAGLLVALGVFGLAALLRRARGEWVTGKVWRSLGVAIGVIAVAGAYIYVTQPIFRLRLVTENDSIWYKSQVVAGQLPPMIARDVVTVPVTLRNEGPMIWRAEGVLAVRASYHWLDATKSGYVIMDGARTPLPHDVMPRESVGVNAIVLTPPKAGDYYLEWDVVQENVTWFSVKGGPAAEPVRVSVGEPSISQPARLPPANLPPPTKIEDISDTSTISRMALWRVAFAMFQTHPITGVGPDGFRNLYGEYAGVTVWNKNIFTNNTYIEMFTNLGLLGGLAFLWLAGLALWRAGRNVIREELSAFWVIGLAATASLVAFFFHGFADYFLFSTPMYTIFWLLMALSVLWPRLVASRQ
jgi:hypothetical protein